MILLSMRITFYGAVQLSAALERVRAGADVMPRRQLEKVLVAELGDGWRGEGGRL